MLTRIPLQTDRLRVLFPSVRHLRFQTRSPRQQAVKAVMNEHAEAGVQKPFDIQNITLRTPPHAENRVRADIAEPAAPRTINFAPLGFFWRDSASFVMGGGRKGGAT